MKKCLLFSTLLATMALFATEANNTCKANDTCKKEGAKVCNAPKCKKAKKSEKKIGKKTAIETALNHAGLKREEVRDLQCEIDREDGVIIYEVEFEAGQHDYEYDIEAFSGKILKSKKELD